MRKKGQIKLMETMGILVIFFLLIVFGFSFYSKIGESKIEKAKDKSFDLKTIELAQTTLFIAELQCTQEESVDVSCVDYEKMIAFVKLLNNNNTDGTYSEGYNEEAALYYFNIFGKAKIELYQVFPPVLDVDGDYSAWTLYDQMDSRYSSKVVTHTPVSIYYPISQKYAFGYYRIEVTS